MKKYTGLLGYPVSHSISPQIHNNWYNEENLDFEYLTFPIAPEDLGSFIDTVKNNTITLPTEGQLKGFSVTIPHKESIIPFLNKIDQTAIEIGAVNTVIVNKNFELQGHNTDWKGWVNSLSETQKSDIKTTEICLIGAGGAAQAIAYALKHLNISNVTVYNRTLAKAEQLAQKYNFKSAKTLKDLTSTTNKILINATPIGLKNKDPLPLPSNLIQSANTVYDLLYNQNSLSDFCLQHNVPYYNGMSMLIEQAKLQHKLFTTN